MADKNHGSIYEKYWIMIRECRKKRGAIVELAVPDELQEKVIKAIRKRKWLTNMKAAGIMERCLQFVIPKMQMG